MDLGDSEGTVALRVPDHELARDILRGTGPMAVSSANLSGQPAALSCDEAVAQLEDRVAVYLDGGPVGMGEGAPSTIVDFTREATGQVLRHGALSVAELREICPDLEDLVDRRARASTSRALSLWKRNLALQQAQSTTLDRLRDDAFDRLRARVVREYLLVMLVAAAITFLASGLCRRLALRTGAMAEVRDRDVHTIAMPYFGGVAMLAGVVGAIVLAWHLPFLGRQVVVQQDSRAVLIAAGVICLVGVLDDLFDLPALTKFAGQVLAAGIVVALGVRMLWIPLPGQTISLDGAASVAITVFFIVLCSNAVNFVDGLDGLATGVVGIGAVAFFAYSYFLTVNQELSRATTSSLITVAIAGACLGFLPHNFFPARMFMGDSGAMLLGLLLATSTISLTGQIDTSQLADGTGGLVPTVLPLVLPIAILALPFLDLVLAFVRRTYAGRWWFVADKQHLHHRLLERGHSQRRAVVLMYIWSALVSFGVIVLGLVTNDRQWQVVAVVVVLALVLLLITVRPPRAGTTSGDRGRSRSSNRSKMPSSAQRCESQNPC